MKAEFDLNPAAPTTLGGRLFKLCKDNAEAANRYSDNGIWGTLMYQFTGDRKYLELAWAKITSGAGDGTQSFLQQNWRGMSDGALFNYVREYAVELDLFYDWLYPGLTPERRSQYMSHVNEMYNEILVARRSTTGPTPVRANDTDQTVGTFFGLAGWYLATRDENTSADRLWSLAGIGGLDATGVDRVTMRNTVAQYLREMAVGGEWMESSDYNAGTLQLLLLGYEAVRTAAGGDHFPEVGGELQNLAMRQVYYTTPDLKQSIQWGDEEHPRDFVGRLYKWQTLNGLLAGLTPGTPGGQAIQQLTLELFARYGERGYNSAEPVGRFFLLFDPYAGGMERSGLPHGWYASGQGVAVMQDGWGSGDSQAWLHFPPGQQHVDHQVAYWGDFQLYRKGEWVITHPIAYNGATYALDPAYADGVNSVIVSGLSSVPDPFQVFSAVPYKRVKALKTGSDYMYLAGVSGGPYEMAPYWDPPPTYLHEWSRSTLYLPSADKKSDTIVIYDRVNALDPKTLPKFDRYSSKIQSLVSAAPARKQWVIHSPVAPSLTADAIAWTTAGGQRVRVSTLLPASQQRLVYDESVLYGTGSGSMTIPSERKWQTRILPAGSNQWDTFLNVVQAFDPGYSVENALVQNTVDQVEGVVLHRQGLADAVAIFNARPGAQLPTDGNGAGVERALDAVSWRSTSFVIGWNQTTATARAFIADLDPRVAWSVSVDGGAVAPLSSDTSGLLTLDVQGVGPHVLRFVASATRPQAPTHVTIR